MNTYSLNRSQLAEDLINTYDLYLSEPEHLRQPDDLKRFLAARGLKITTANATDLESVRELRTRLRDIWTAPTLNEALGLLNPLLGEVTVSIQAVLGAEDTIQMALQTPVDAELLPTIAMNAALGIVEVLQAHGLERMRACAAEPCRDVFVDTSRNRSRRFCSERCANRYNTAAFRERQRDED